MTVRLKVDSNVVRFGGVMQVLNSRRDARYRNALHCVRRGSVEVFTAIEKMLLVSDCQSEENARLTRTSVRYLVEAPLAYAVWTTPTLT